MNACKRTMPCIAAVSVLLLVFTAGARAQTVTGTISGTVADPTGAVVPGAKVTVTNVDTGATLEAETNEVGTYVFVQLSPATYEITVQAEGFGSQTKRATLAVAQRLRVDFSITVAAVAEVVTVTESGIAVNTESGQLSSVINTEQIVNLPSLTRNPYDFMQLTPGAVDTASVVGDAGGLGNTPGLAIGGSRSRSANYMLDGGENNETFIGAPGQLVPLDAIQEYRIQANNMTAEFGRSTVAANVVTKSGGNDLHGTVYYFYRGAALSSTPFDDNANGLPKSNFVRNQFGASGGGSIIKDKFFYFGSFEGIRVRSSGSENFLVPTQDFLNAASTNTAAFVTGFGGLPSSDCSRSAVTAGDINAEESITLLDANGVAIPAATNLFCFTSVRAPTDAGGGLAQDTWLWTARLDYQWQNGTRLSGRYAFEQIDNPDGSNSVSPYAGFFTGVFTRNQNLNLTLTHSFSPTFFTETRGTFNRLLQEQPLGAAPSTTPCWEYALNRSFGSEQIVFPGYVPDVCIFSGIPFGGPQNIYQGFHGGTLLKGKHTFKYGIQYVHLRDNRTFGAFANGFFLTGSMQDVVDGNVDLTFLAIDPKGKFPGDSFDPVAEGGFVPPSFTRHFRYNEVAWYFEDSIKLLPRFTLDLGLRWEYFGVLHSPTRERALGFDSNLFLGAVGPGSTNFFERIRDARFARTNNLFQQDFNNFAPRVGFAWDLMGNGQTVLRGGYGLFYDRNFGNALFNVIQNWPNYAVLVLTPADFGGASIPIQPNQFDSLSAALAAGGASALTLSGSARMLNPEMVTAYSAQWNLTLEHDILKKGFIASVSYLGANGYQLYSLNNLNKLGSCALAPSISPTCVVDSFGPDSRLNQTGLTGMNRRGNEGFSRYNALVVDFNSRRHSATGLMLKGSYTWAHSIDNSTSFFGDSIFEAFFGFGFRDPFNPALDRADSTNDIRHRTAIGWDWEVPFARNREGAVGKVLDGWQLTGIFTAQTGGKFTVYDIAGDCFNSDGTNFCHPILAGSVPSRQEIPSGSNLFTLYDISSTFTTVTDFCAGDVACEFNLINLQGDTLSPRNLFTTPGIWNVNLGVFKNTRVGERFTVQFRAEFFNLFNHSNLYAIPGTNAVPGATVDAAKGLVPGGVAAGVDRRNVQLALKFIW